MTCRDCRAKTCFTHKCPWHEGLTCYEFDHPKRAMRTRQFANAGTKRQLHGLGQTSAKRLRGISRSNKATGEGSGALAERQAEEEREAEENRQKEEERRKEELLERRKEEHLL
ncbi:uncharacterized protein BDV14DRAFT_167630 [Aspergillus stella-maris]|uniref:uncharacterized protein n=1 Tax=Aspergillus stella-maris TaxID=1810926 RepID=UPI003CCCFA4A